MTSRALSKIRVVFSILVLLLIVAVFLDIRHLIPEKYINIILFLQFIPSASKFISAGQIASVGFLVILSLTFLTGRTYCSFLCPLGVFQDITSRIGGKLKKRFRRFGLRKSHTFLRYSLLIITLILTMIWGVYLLTLLDPYSIFGRLMTYFGRPAALGINNLLSNIFTNFDIYTFVHIPVTWFPPVVYIIPAAFLLLVGIMSLTKGRLFCNMICPVGTLLGLISKISVLRIRLDDPKCTKCGRCALACKSSCIDFLNKNIDLSRCVYCFNCIDSCQDKAVKYSIVSMKRNEPVVTDETRRKVILSSLFLVLGSSVRTSGQEKLIPVPQEASNVREDRTTPVSPPGSTSISNFTSKCIACSLCISVCPNNVLIPSYRDYGIAGIMQPHLDYHRGFCAYECVRCTEVCPTGAMLPLDIDAKKLTQIGKARFIEDNCIVKTEKTACGACAESCPTKAVHMIPYEGTLVIPKTTEEICIGCGHCEYACPTTPYKSIYINGNPSHSAAKKPESTQTEMKTPAEFPF